MKEIKITNGAVVLKDFCSRKLKKDINKALLSGAEIKTNDGKSELSNISFEAMDKANDIALLGMTEKIIINGEEKQPSITLFDEMDEAYVQIVLAEINKITNKGVPLA